MTILAIGSSTYSPPVVASDTANLSANTKILGDRGLQAFADENRTTVDQLFRDNPDLTYHSGSGTAVVVNPNAADPNVSLDASNPPLIAAAAPPRPRSIHIDPVPSNQASVNSTTTYTTQSNGLPFYRRDYNPDVGGTQTWTKIVQATPYYRDSAGNQHMLQIGEQAPSSARFVYYDATETVYVRNLQGSELGELQGLSPDQIKTKLAEARAEQEKFYSDGNVKNPSTGQPFRSLEEARQYSRSEHYYGTGPHLLAAKAAEARTGGLIPAQWFMANDPFMGRAGSNAEYFPSRTDGLYPGYTSKIGVAHDADYGLGATFAAGPLAGLSRTTSQLSGQEGLAPYVRESHADGSSKVYPQYGTGNADWNVTPKDGQDFARPVY